jgi:hypothetical protein
MPITPKTGSLFHAETQFCGLQGSFGAFGDHFALMLADSGQDMERQLVGVRIINSDELDPRVHHRGDKGEVIRVRRGDRSLPIPLCQSSKDEHPVSHSHRRWDKKRKFK